MASKRHLANGSIIAESPVISSSLVMMARAFGIMVRAVAVFEIHMPKKVVTSIMPSNKSHGFNPKIKTVLRAILE